MGIIKRNLSQSSLWGEYILIFVCVGSREYQFDRLIKKIDELVENKEINDEVFGQIGQSTYIPKNFRYKRFMSVDEFKDYQRRADLIISHAGTGALIGALKLKKQVIAVPRLAKYGEHIDDHQIQIAQVLEDEGYLRCVLDMDNLANIINSLNKNKIKKYYDNPSKIIDIINNYIDNNK